MNEGKKYRILIVEDEKIIAKDLELRLLNMNYEVAASVSTGREAIAIVRSQQVDLILMDIMIDGDIDGIETAELIHQQMDVPVIYLTAYADEKTFERARLSDPFGYLLKPFQERDLDLTIRTVLQKFSYEKQIKTSETRYRGLFEQSMDAIVVFDNDGNLLDANPVACELFSVPEGMLKGLNISGFVQPKERMLFQANLRNFLNDGETRGRYKYIDRFLRIRYLEFQAKANYLPGSHLAVLRDITKSVLDQRQIENLAKFPSEAPHPTLRISTGGEILYANKAASIFLNEWKPKYGNSIPNNILTRINHLGPGDHTMSLSLNIRNRYFLLLFVYVRKGDYINIYATDITQQKQSERILNHQKDIMELIAKGESLPAVLERICAKLHQFMPEALPAIHLYDENSKQLNFACGPRIPLNFVASIQRMASGKNSASMGTAAMIKDMVVVQDIHQDASWKDRISEAEKIGIQSSWTVPVLGQHDELLAIVTLFHKNNHKPNHAETMLVSMACKLTGIAVEREQNYKSLIQHSLTFENISDAIVLTGEDKRISEWSPSAERLFHFRKGELLGKKISEVSVFENRETIEEQVDEVFNGLDGDDAKFTSEISFLKKNGEKGIAELSIVNLKDPAGAVIGQIRVFRDISQKKKVEMALRTSENYLKAIFDNTIQSFILLDLEFRILTFNKKASDFIRELTGKKLAAGEPLTDYWGQDTIEEYVEIAAMAQGGEFVKYEQHMEALPSGPIWLEINFLPVYGEDNHISSICFTALDISERKQAELELASSEARFRSLVQNSSDIVTVLDEEGKVQYSSESTEKMLGLSGTEMIGKYLAAIVLEEDQEAYRQAFRETIRKKENNHSIEYQIRDGSGQIRYVESVMNNLLEDKSVQGVVVNSRDITQRKDAEISLKQTNFELDSFVYRASHDLRAPLRSVLGLLNLVKMEPAEAQKNAYINLAEKSINKLDSFILDLTNFSRNSRMEVQRDPINFREVIGECVENLKYMENADRVKLVLNIEEDVPFLSDQGRMNILFQNLISNAIKYQRPGADSFVKVDVKTNEAGAEISVADNGKGIHAEYLDRIFDMFFRASEDSYGSGLGLYITRQVVEKLGGKIRVASAYGEGSTFSIYLPQPGLASV